jgi:hypothetical protein
VNVQHVEFEPATGGAIKSVPLMNPGVITWTLRGEVMRQEYIEAGAVLFITEEELAQITRGELVTPDELTVTAFTFDTDGEGAA